MRTVEESKGQIETWRNLEVWQLAHELVLKVYEMAKRFPPEERFQLTDQLRRAAASIPTNIAEGKGRSSLKEYLQFLSILYSQGLGGGGQIPAVSGEGFRLHRQFMWIYLKAITRWGRC